MKSDTSFLATIYFALLVLGGLIFGNVLVSLATGSGWAVYGTLAALLATGAAYGSQLMTTNGLTLDELLPDVTTQTQYQAVQEASAFAHQWSRTLQVASLGFAIVSGILLVVALP